MPEPSTSPAPSGDTSRCLSNDRDTRLLETTSPAAVNINNPRRFHVDRRADKLAKEIAAGGDPDELLSDAALAELTGLSEQWFSIARVRGYGPLFVRLSPRVTRVRRADYVRWLEERTHRRTAEYADENASNRGRLKGSRVVDGKVIPPQQQD